MRMIRQRWAVVSLTFAGAVLVGCSDQAPMSDQSPMTDAEVTVAATDGGIDFRNATDGPVAYTALERHYFETSLALWGPCPDLSTCRLDPGEDTIIPFAAIVGYTDGATEAVVVWWRIVVDGNGGFQAEDPQTVSVVLVPGASAIDATVAFANVDAGCWVLKTDSVVYEPVTLAENLKVGGLDVHAVVEPVEGVSGICMAGRIVRALSIEAR